MGLGVLQAQLLRGLSSIPTWDVPMRESTGNCGRVFAVLEVGKNCQDKTFISPEATSCFGH